MDEANSIYQIKDLSEDMNSEMLKILRESPIESKGTLICFDREPDIYSLAKLKYDKPVYKGFFRLNELLGIILPGYYKAFVNGKPETVVHLTNIFVKESGRYKGFYYRASKAFFKDIYMQSRIGYSIIMKGNSKAEALISRHHERYPDLPFNKIIDTLITKIIIILFKKRETTRYKVRTASMADIDTIISLLQKDFSKRLFAPFIDKKEFLDNLAKRPNFGIENYYVAEYKNNIVGVCAVWDCSSFKQIRVLHYGKQLRIIKFLLSFLIQIFGILRLPEEGNVMKEVYITDYAVENRNPLIMKALLNRVYNDCKKKKYNMIIFGSCERDPLLKAAKGFINVDVKSSIIMGCKSIELYNENEIDTSLPYIDMALL